MSEPYQAEEYEEVVEEVYNEFDQDDEECGDGALFGKMEDDDDGYGYDDCIAEEEYLSEDFEEITVEESLDDDDGDDGENQATKDGAAAGEQTRRPAEISVSQPASADTRQPLKQSVHAAASAVPADDHASTAPTIDSSTENTLESPTLKISSHDSAARRSTVDLHRHLDTSDWHAMLEAVEKLKAQDKELIIAELCALTASKATPVHTAVWKAPLQLTKLLVSIIPFHSRETILSKQDSDGNTPLHLACANLELDSKTNTIDLSIVEILSMGAPATHQVRNWQGDIPLHLLVSSSAYQANPSAAPGVEVKCDNFLRSVLEQFAAVDDTGTPSLPRLTSVQNKNGATPLHAATGFGAFPSVQHTLVQFDRDAVAIADNVGMLPLHYIAACKHEPGMDPSVASKLVSLHPAGIVQQSNAGDTALHLLVSNSRKRFAKSVHLPKLEQLVGALNGDEANGESNDEQSSPMMVKNREALTPLHCCALFKAQPVVSQQLMQSKHAERASLAKDQHGATPLHLACASSNVAESIDTVRILATKAAASKKDNIGRTPMHIAAENRKSTRSLIKLLVDLDPRPTKMETARGRMPLHVAIKKKADVAVLRALVKVYPKATRAHMSGSNTVLHEACQYNVPTNAIKAILSANADAVKEKNRAGNTVLHVATAYRTPIETIRILLDAYPDATTVRNKNEDVPLHYAASYSGNSEIVKLLADEAPKSVICKNADGQTPLDNARKAAVDTETIELLEKLSKSVKLDLPSNDADADGSIVSEERSLQMDDIFIQNDLDKKKKKRSGSSSRLRRSNSSSGNLKSKRSGSRSRRRGRTSMVLAESQLTADSADRPEKDNRKSRSRSHSKSRRKSRTVNVCLSSKSRPDEGKSARKQRSASRSKRRSKSPLVRRRSTVTSKSDSSSDARLAKTPSGSQRKARSSISMNGFEKQSQQQEDKHGSEPALLVSPTLAQSDNSHRLGARTPKLKRNASSQVQKAPKSAPMTRSRSAMASRRTSEIQIPDLLSDDRASPSSPASETVSSNLKSKTPMTIGSRKTSVKTSSNAALMSPPLAVNGDSAKGKSKSRGHRSLLSDMLNESLRGLQVDEEDDAREADDNYSGEA